jgi:hypothetical protein
MTETISNANAAASTLFLGHSGEWWDFWLIISVIIAALAATAIGVATVGSIVSHKRGAAAAEQALNLYKLETEEKIAEANARTKTAELELFKLRLPRNVDAEKFAKALSGVPKAKVEILYVKECSDCFWVAQWLSDGLKHENWDHTVGPIIPPDNPTGQAASLPSAILVRGQPWGVTVVGPYDAVVNNELKFRGLFSAVAASLDGSVTTGTSDPNMPDGSLRIVVAPKP